LKPNRQKDIASATLPQLKTIHVFALIFTVIFLLHGPLLRLPYFWDEAGYYIPAAYDFFSHGSLIPQSIPSNAHPPLPSIYLALWWKLSGFKPAVTRTAMLLLAALGLTAVFRLGQMLANSAVAVAVTVCVAIYPVWFAQSSFAHADLPAASFVLCGLLFYFRALLGSGFREQSDGLVLVSKQEIMQERSRARRDIVFAGLCFAVAGLCKETSIIFPVTLAVYDFAENLKSRGPQSRILLRPAVLFVSTLPLGLWFAYHRLHTGFFFGNQEFFSYNVSNTLTPLRILLSIVLRLWQILGYMNLWLLTVATLWLMAYPPLREESGSERRRITPAVQFRMAALIVGNVLLFSAIGGATLARYLLPLYPLIILIGVSTLRRRLAHWPWAVALVAAAFVLALFSPSIGYIPPEDNLSYRDYVILHKEAADYLERHLPNERILTAWTATDELTKPLLGYVHQPLSVTHIENFSLEQLQLARMTGAQYDAALLFSTKQQPGISLLDRWSWWEGISRRYFGFHRDLRPELAARMLGGRILWQRSRGQQWIALVGFDRVENAKDNSVEQAFRPALRN
jgi:4-amino-4-deoxy-L-arabinose transferase-like glycosyltransferase